MAFMNKFKGIDLPTARNLMNVAKQTVRQVTPDKKDYEQPPGGVNMPQPPVDDNMDASAGSDEYPGLI